MKLVGLDKVKDELAKNLPHGYQKMLGIARALAVKPKLLLLDEPSLGLAPIVVEHLGEVIKDINQEGVSVFLVEQNIPLALQVATMGYALQVGRIVLEGKIDEFKSTEIVRRAYLGA